MPEGALRVSRIREEVIHHVFDVAVAMYVENSALLSRGIRADGPALSGHGRATVPVSLILAMPPFRPGDCWKCTYLKTRPTLTICREPPPVS